MYDGRCVRHSADGYTNLRELPQVSSKILLQLKSGTTIMSISTEGSWYHVITKDGTVGYVHTSRLKLKTPAGVL